MLKAKKFPKKTIHDVPLEGKTVLVRADYNVPLASDGTIADDFRIRQSLPTLTFLLKQKCKLVLCAHLGRPDGRINSAFSLQPVAQRLSELLKLPVGFVPAAIGDNVLMTTKKMQPGQVVLLENLRFYAGEEANDLQFARLLAGSSSANLFVQDGFGVVHRAHASTSAITQFMPSVAGELLLREYTAITAAVNHPERPLVAVLGGAKVSDKIEVIERFVDIADQLIIGGAMANTFLQYNGIGIGKSLYEPHEGAILQRIYKRAEQKLKGMRPVDEFIMLPVDVAVTTDLTDLNARRYTVNVQDIAADEYIVDIGPATIEQAVRHLGQAATVIWNGTLGLAERPQYSYGSARVALALAQQRAHTTSIIGGGDTADFVLGWDAGSGASFSHVSTGGGASLELIAGAAMPGVDALLDG